jgi:hypothetical protein
MPESLGAGEGSSVTASIVIEWENALNSEADRAAAMLRQLRVQVGECLKSRPALTLETLIVYDSEIFAENELRDWIESVLGPAGRCLNWRMLSFPGGGYYASKDHGVRHASSEVVLFMDSDAIPEEGWLDALLKAMSEPNVNVVVGATYIEHEEFLGKTFALNWFFPLRPDSDSMVRTRKLFVNNMALRRDFYLRHPFPKIPGMSRGSCVVLGNRLADENIPVHRAQGARASHPAPNGLRHLVPRALAQGRDRVIRERYLGNRWQQSWLMSCIRLPRHMLGAAWKTGSGHRRVGLGLIQVPAAISVAWFYYFLYWIGETGEHLGLEQIRSIRV